ncbi:MAG: beta-N-acetylhexosaminidase [Gemmatimonadaceae bacterium]
MRSHHTRRLGQVVASLTLAACSARRGGVAPQLSHPEPALAHTIVPAPAQAQITPGQFFVVDSATVVVIDQGATADVERIGDMLAGMVSIHPANAAPRSPGVTGPRVARARRLASDAAPPAGSLRLVLAPDRQALGAEGYELDVATDRVTLVARDANGLFYGVQTIRQLLPPSVENAGALGRQLRIPAGHIADVPRFTWRGSMLDVSRHFLGADDVKRYIDVMALYKLNRLHLHLSDDQGWRIEIRSWPNLARFGGLTEVGGGVGGFYTQEQFADLVSYARSRFIEVVPEIEMPAHINAALSAYPELNCDGATPAYTGIAVGFSALCVQRDTTYRFVDDVVREVSAMIPSPWIHVGGDEVEKLTHEQYKQFIERVQQIVTAHGKQMIGWGEIATANLAPSSIVQHWRNDSAHVHAARGGKVILSPGSRTYLDMKYDSATVLGLKWAGLIDVQHAYDWEPATLRPGVPEHAILGIEGPLWSETLEKLSDYEFMAFPRLLALAEVAWSPAAARGWDQFRWRLGAQGPRLQALGVNFYRAPEVPWSR